MTPEEELDVVTEELEAVKKERDDYCMALSAISDIRDSIVGQQGFNFSEHAYPLVAVLGSVGFEGKGYEIARENLGTLIEQAKRAEEKVVLLRTALLKQGCVYGNINYVSPPLRAVRACVDGKSSNPCWVCVALAATEPK